MNWLDVDFPFDSLNRPLTARTVFLPKTQTKASLIILDVLEITVDVCDTKCASVMTWVSSEFFIKSPKCVKLTTFFLLLYICSFSGVLWNSFLDLFHSNFPNEPFLCAQISVGSNLSVFFFLCLLHFEHYTKEPRRKQTYMTIMSLKQSLMFSVFGKSMRKHVNVKKVVNFGEFCH